MTAAARRGPPGRGGAHPGPPRQQATSLAALVAAADDLDQAIERLARSPGIGPAALAELGRRRPSPGRGSPLSTAVLVRLAARCGGPDGLAAVLPFLADADAVVQVEAAEAVDAAPPPALREALERLAASRPDGEFWEAVVGLLQAREAQGTTRLLAGLAGRLSHAGAVAAILEALPYVAEPAETSFAARTIRRFLGDGRPVPGADTDEGPVTIALVAAEALDPLAVLSPAAGRGAGGDDGR
jgi:hypothetical protein